MPRKKKEKQVLLDFKKAHGNFYDYSLVKYTNSSTKIQVICPNHGIFEITPGHHQKGVGCRKCYFESQKITKEEFITRSQVYFGNRYYYSVFDQLPSNGQKVIIFCVEHNEKFLQEPRNHMKGHTGCSICKSLKLSGFNQEREKIKSKQELTQKFIERAQQVHESAYDYSNFEYVNGKTKGKVICPVHGTFWQTPL